MHVLIVTQYFWPETFRINDVAVGLRERGHQVTVLTGLPNYPEGKIYSGYSVFTRRQNYEGIEVLRVPIVTRGKSKGLRLMANFASFPLSAGVLGPSFRHRPIDVILVFQTSPVTVALPAIWVKRLRHVPMLLWVLDLWPETLAATGAVRSPWVLRQVDRLVRHVYQHCDLVLVQSEGFVPSVQSRGVSRDRIRYFPSHAEAFFRPLALPSDSPERRELPKGFRILFAGNIGESQSFDTILEAARRTRHRRDLQWIVLGDGRDRPRVENEIRRHDLGATVHLLGRRPVETMPRYYAAADALLASLKRQPVFALTVPGKVQSYLACGKPILAALEGEGARIVTESGAGLVAPPEDPGLLAQRAVELSATRDEERVEMGRRGRAYFENNFDRQRLLDRLESWMLELTHPQRRAAAA